MSELECFRALGLSEPTLAALTRKGFEEPTPIQALTIPILLKGEQDVIGQAQTGTGKTAAFGIPILETVAGGSRRPQALVLAPTRELSMQIAEEIQSLKGDRALSIAAVYGGQSIEVQLERLRRGVDIVIGTPGRVIDLMNRGKLDWGEIRFAVLDEADEMLNMGFIEDIELILSSMPEEKRMLMFSATMPEEIRRIAERFMRPGYEVVQTKADLSATGLTHQIYFEVRREDKLEALSRIIDMESDMYAMVFCRTRNDVDELTEKLQADGYPVEALHGDIAQAQRTKVIARFKKRSFRILIATDVAARGIDVNDLTHVINFSLPQGTESYVHRIGRTGRAGKTGTAITFVTPAEYRRLTRIQREAHTDIRQAHLPQGKEIVEAKKQQFVEKLTSVIEAGEHDDYLGFAEELLSVCDHPADIFAAMLRLKFKKELLESSYTELGAKRRSGREESDPDERGRTRLFIGVGKLDNFTPPKLLDLVCTRSAIPKFRIGKIDCFDKFSFVNVRFSDAERIVDAFRSRGPKVEIARDKDDAPNGAPEKPAAKKAAKAPKAPKAEKTEKPKKAPKKMREWLMDLEASAPPPASKKRGS